MSPVDVLSQLPPALVEEARDRDANDPLAAHREAFVLPAEVVAYLDGNSLGRPLKATRDNLTRFVDGEWGTRLIRSWDERWMQRPLDIGDLLGRVVLGAAAGQTVVGDSTTVLLYKLIRAAVAAQPGRTEIIADTENFPTDRFLVDAIAAETGSIVRWIDPDPRAGVVVEQVEQLLSDRTSLVLLSQVAYKSAFIADLPAITAATHRAGALVLWDLSHSAGVIAVELDAADVDLAVGCSYKYLNGGPGAPAFAYVAERLHDRLTQPIAGWMGAAEPFTMGVTYAPAPGIRRFVSGTPPILAMLPVRDMVELIEVAGIANVRAKSVQLTEFAIKIADQALAPLGVTVASPRDPDVRGAHVTFEHDAMQVVVAQLWDRGVIPDYRRPHGLRAGLSPLTTSFTEVAIALAHVADVLGASHRTLAGTA